MLKFLDLCISQSSNLKGCNFSVSMTETSVIRLKPSEMLCFNGRRAINLSKNHIYVVSNVWKLIKSDMKIKYFTTMP